MDAIQSFAALTSWQLLSSALKAAVGACLLQGFSRIVGLEFGGADVLPLYGLFVLDEMGCRFRANPTLMLVVAGVLAVIANAVNLVIQSGAF